MVASASQVSGNDARAAQARRGLAYAAAIVGGWAALLAASLFAFPLSWATLPLAVALAAVQCWLFVGLFIVAHDAMHGSLAPGHAQVNRVIGAGVLALYAGFSWRKLAAAHFAHHRHAGTADDPDFSAEHPDNGWRWYLTFLTRYFGWRSLLFVGAVVAALHVLGGVSLGKLALFYAVPAIASSVQLFYFGTYRPHRHSAEAGFADRHNARSEGWGRMASLASCFHFGYHLEHHRRPDVPWWGLPDARAQGVGS